MGKEGSSFVPQNKNVFAGMTVEENLEMGAFLLNEEIENIIGEIYELFPILKAVSYTHLTLPTTPYV